MKNKPKVILFLSMLKNSCDSGNRFAPGELAAKAMIGRTTPVVAKRLGIYRERPNAFGYEWLSNESFDTLALKIHQGLKDYANESYHKKRDRKNQEFISSMNRNNVDLLLHAKIDRILKFLNI